jgi:phospholipase/carboxylesterase
MSGSIIVQRPIGPAEQLFLLHHGVGASALSMKPLAEAIAREFKRAFVVSVQAPNYSDLGAGFEWFSIRGVTEANRQERVEQALSGFIAEIRAGQRESGLTAHATAVIGFSQGAIMSLALAESEEAFVSRIFALSGRFARLPSQVEKNTTLHLIHGKGDLVIHYQHCIAAAERLRSVGADFTAEVIPFLGHEVNEEVIQALLQKLSQYLPKRHWDAALLASKDF